MKELIVFDIDGTLVDPASHKIPASTLCTLNKLHEKGIPLAIATGPSITNGQLLPHLNFISWGGYVCNNGLSVYDGNFSPLFKAFMPQPLIDQCINVAMENNLNLCFQSENRYFLLKEPDRYTSEAYSFLNTNIRAIDSPDGQNIFAIVAFGPKTWDYEPYKKINGISVLYSSSTYADLVMSNHSKSTGIRFLMKYLGYERYIAFGDSMNDYDMLRNADISIAMGQGDNQLKQIASFVTKPVSEEGIYYACKHLGLI